MSSNVRFTGFKSDKQPTWCPGCEDFRATNGIMKTLANSGIDLGNTLMVASIGCSGKIGMYIHSYTIHGVHGRLLPVAADVELANPDLTVVATGGGGDGYSTGAGYLTHAVRHNVDVTYTVMDNCIYGFMKEQASSTSRGDFEISTTPEGPQQPLVDPSALSLATGGMFIAQPFTTGHKRHTEIVREAIERDDFGFANMFSPCITLNDADTYDHFRDSLVDPADTDHDPTDYDAAKEKALDSPKEYESIIYEDESSVSYEEGLGVDQDMSDIPSGAPDDVMDLVREFY